MGPFGEPGRGSLTRDDGGHWTWSVSLAVWEPCEGNLEGGLFYWGP